MNNVVVLDAARTQPVVGTAEQKVAVGGVLLDQVRPEWWQDGQVDLKILDLRMTRPCVLGQLYGDWLIGLDVLFPNLPHGAKYVAAEHAGFWVNQRQNPDDALIDWYEQLNVQWRRAIVARRETWR